MVCFKIIFSDSIVAREEKNYLERVWFVVLDGIELKKINAFFRMFLKMIKCLGENKFF